MNTDTVGAHGSAPSVYTWLKDSEWGSNILTLWNYCSFLSAHLEHIKTHTHTHKLLCTATRTQAPHSVGSIFEWFHSGTEERANRRLVPTTRDETISRASSAPPIHQSHGVTGVLHLDVQLTLLFHNRRLWNPRKREFVFLVAVCFEGVSWLESGLLGWYCAFQKFIRSWVQNKDQLKNYHGGVESWVLMHNW